MKKSKKRIILICVIAVIALATTSVYAYFTSRAKLYTNDGQTSLVRAGMGLGGFFDIINSDSSKTQVNSGASLGILCTDSSVTTGVTQADANGNRYYTYNPNAEWGSANNPYIISKVNHLQNLYVLQNMGYFQSKINSTVNKISTNASVDFSTAIPYFLVCGPDGRPTTIDGTNKKFSEPIGNEEHPFIGYCGGAFVTGTNRTTVANGASNGPTSDVSTIYNVKVNTTTDNIDFGLFGTIGVIGDEENPVSNSEDPHFGYFKGVSSTVRDLLLYDVQIVVKPQTWLDKLASGVSHMFTYGKYTGPDNFNTADNGGHENHHIGILCGHAEYATIEYISVYYSADNINAMEVSTAQSSGMEPNFRTDTGIIGYIHNVNPDIDGVYIGIGTSTISSTVIEGASGTGGGLLSGTGRGYVTAKDICNLYDDSGNIVKYTVTTGSGDETTVTEMYGVLVVKNGNRYTLEDGTTTVTVNVNNGTASFTDTYQSWLGFNRTETVTWTDFVVKDGNNYYNRGTTKLVDNNSVTKSGIILRYGYNAAEGEYLCTQWVRDRLLGGGNWTQRMDSFYFTDGVFTFALSTPKDTIDETWDDLSNIDKYSVGVDDNASWTVNYSKGNKAVVAFLKPILSTSNLDTAISSGKKIFILTKGSDNSTFLMTLNTQSAKETFDGDDTYSTSGTTQHFASDDVVDSLAQSFAGGGIDTIPGYTNQQVAEALRNGSLQVLNVGTATEINDITSLKNEYQIIPSAGTASGTYRFRGNNSASNYLQLLYRRYLFFGSYYSIWCGGASEIPSGSLAIEHSRQLNANVNFTDSSTGACRISYNYNNNIRYVYYDSRDRKFTGTSSSQNAATLYLYTVEDARDIDFGYVTFEPKDGTNYAAKDISADEYVLWPTGNSAVGSAQTNDPNYYVVPVNLLQSMENKYYNKTSAENCWRNKNGQILSRADLVKKFTMKEGITFGITLAYNGGQLNTDGFITAPVGSLGVTADIPEGCVAFRVNQDAPNGEHYYVRVIVSVPVSEYYRGQQINGANVYDLTWNNDYYLGIWQVESANGNGIRTFSATGAKEKIELPRSNPYQPGTNTSGAYSNYINTYFADTTDKINAANPTQYRTYLNGSRVLVAYAFETSQQGVYVIGTCNTAGSDNNFPMEIVYFSADAVASAGRDGVQGSAMGTIDFVYGYPSANPTRIVTVKDTNAAGDYSGYFASLSLLQTANEDTAISGNYNDICNFVCRIRRLVGTVGNNQQSYLKLTATGADQKYIYINRYNTILGDYNSTNNGSGTVWDPSQVN